MWHNFEDRLKVFLIGRKQDRYSFANHEHVRGQKWHQWHPFVWSKSHLEETYWWYSTVHLIRLYSWFHQPEKCWSSVKHSKRFYNLNFLNLFKYIHTRSMYKQNNNSQTPKAYVVSNVMGAKISIFYSIHGTGFLTCTVHHTNEVSMVRLRRCK